MAKIVLGIGASHGPMLGTPPELWTLRAKADLQIDHWFRGDTYSFDALKALRVAEQFSPDISLAKSQARHAACARAIEELAQVYEDARPDVAVIFGNDQQEAFGDDQIPAFLIYAGSELFSTPLDDATADRLEPGIAIAQQSYRPASARTYPGHPALGDHITETLISNEFDIAYSQRMPRGGNASRDGQVPHAFGFIYERIMRGRVIPNVPIFTNTFYPPNTPKVKRCLAMARAVRQAIESWDSDLRVAVFGSGGLTHFAIDEDLDRRFLDAFVSKNLRELEDLPDNLFRAGTSELKNWIPLASTMFESGLDMTLVDYVPCYRTEAGTGNAMGFAYWR